MSPELLDRLEIRAGIENWMIWRDSGDWDRFATLWHPESRMTATWFQGSGAEFVERGRQAWNNGVGALHVMSGISIDLSGDRAIAQTRSIIMQRGPVHGVDVDVACYGRFWDAWEKIDGTWLLRLRQPIYERDMMIPVDPRLPPTLNTALLACFPEGYRNLAYLQTQLGFDVYRSMPGTRGPEVEALIAAGRAWLAGDSAEGLLRATEVKD